MKRSTENPNLLSASQVANALDISVKTLTNWYRWYFDDTIKKDYDFPKLPEYFQEYQNGPRYWTKEDIPQLIKFQDWLPRGRNGVMGRISEQYWGERKPNRED